MYTPQTPFESIESAQEYLGLLSKAIADAKEAVEVDLSVAADPADQTSRALQLISYSLGKLGSHIRISHRILNDLLLLGRVLREGRDSKQRERVFRSSALSQSNIACTKATSTTSPESPKQPQENGVEVRALDLAASDGEVLHEFSLASRSPASK